jgi:hypothetical protein
MAMTSVRGRNHETHNGSPKSTKPKKAIQVKSKMKSMLINFFDINEAVHKEFVLAGQTVNSAYKL